MAQTAQTVALVQLWARKPDDADYTRLDLFNEEPIKLNLSVTNIVDPLSTTSVFSRTFRVPNTQANNEFFKAAFNVNSVSFDASQKIAAYINDSGAFYTNGHIRLIATYQNDLDGNVEYEIVFMGETSDFGSQIGGGFLSDLDLSNYNHDQTYLNITQSWNTNPANGLANGLFGGDVVYPLCNWGYTYAPNPSTGITEPQQSGSTALYNATSATKGFTSASNPLSQAQLKPSIRAKALWDKIFSETEYTYESDFLQSEFFQKLYIISEKEARPEFDVSLTFSADNTSPQWWLALTSVGDIYASHEISDPNGVWNGASTYTAQVTGTYYFTLNYKHRLTPPNAGPIPLYTTTYTISIRDAQSQAVLAQNLKIITNQVSNWTGPTQTMSFTVNLAVNQQVRFTIEPDPVPANTSASIGINNITISCTAAPEIVTLNSMMPNNIRKIDFMRSLINRFKLVFVPSPDNLKHFRITPWKDWILEGQSYDWNQLLDASKDFKAVPLFYDQSRFQIYSDQEDADFPNYTYQLAYKQTYGQLNIDSQNELITGTTTVKDQFAPTPLFPIGGAVPAAGSNPTALAAKFLIPWISKADFTAVQNNPIQPKLRLVFYNGKQAAPLNWYLKDDSGAPQQQTIYPLMSEYSFWPVNSSTFDLSWQNKSPLWNTLYGLPDGRTNYDTFNVYWKTWYGTNFDPYSRKVEATLIMNYKTMIALKFNNYYWIKDAWYLVNKVSDYVAGQTTPCKVELIKVGNELGLTIPPTTGLGYEHQLCYVSDFLETANYCDAYCCAQLQNTAAYWTDNALLSASSIVWQNASQTIPGNPGYYAAADGTVFQVGAGGAIIAYYDGTLCEPCTPLPPLTEFINCCRSGILCTACDCGGTTITLWGDNTTLATSYYIWQDSAGTIAATDGWYMDPADPTLAIQVVNGVNYAVGLCSTCTGVTDTYAAKALVSSIGTGTCDACFGSISQTDVWLNAATWATATQVFLDNAGQTAAGEGYWKAYEELGTPVYITDASGYITGTLNCAVCDPVYYYLAQTCTSPTVIYSFHSNVPISIGQSISSSAFPGQCWTVTAQYHLGVYPADLIYPDCLSCSEGWTCNCLEYTVSTPGFDPAYLSYQDCTTGNTLFQEILPNSIYNICMCEGSGASAEGHLDITETGACPGSDCYTWSIELLSGDTGQVEYQDCNTGLTQSLDVDFGGQYQICAIDGTVVTIFGDVQITQGLICA
jgi:hypothetical protein